VIYIALLRGINVGKKNWISMKLLKDKFEELGYSNVVTYINSGNIIFETKETKANVKMEIETMLLKYLKINVPTIIIKKSQLIMINESIPEIWQNDKVQRTDVAFLFPEVDNEGIVNVLPFKLDYVNLLYVKGAVIWNVKREHVMKSQIAKIIGHKIYPFITIRNINTLRYLANV
jgi:uncharacterized protein (DUF1697 family)